MLHGQILTLVWVASGSLPFFCCAAAWGGRIACIFVHEWLWLTSHHLITRWCWLELHLLLRHACLFPHPMHSAYALRVGVGLSPGLQVGRSREPARRLLLMEDGTLPALWVSCSVVISDYTCQRRTGEAMQWKLSASWEERKRRRFMLCPCSYVLVKRATVPENLISESPAAVSCNTYRVGLTCKCLSHSAIQKKKAAGFVFKMACGNIGADQPPCVVCKLWLCCSAKPDGCSLW